MAAPQNHANSVSPDTLITLKINLNGEPKKLKLPLRDLTATVLPDKLRQCLNVKPGQTAVFERFSDSAGGFVILDPSKPQVFKTLLRAAKAKLKLRIKATVSPLEQQEQLTAPKAEEPCPNPTNTAAPTNEHSPQVLLHTLTHPRDPSVTEGRSMASGIFQFREARSSQQTLVNPTEAPVPHPFVATSATPREMPLRVRETPSQIPHTNGQPWSVYCNECDASMTDAHFHCGICDAGDYDLCESCVAKGKLCPGEGHWLIKRFIKNGSVIASQTERISPRFTRPTPVPSSPKKMPGAFTDDSKTLLTDDPYAPTRTCNNCVVILPEREFVTCKVCEDFDLCVNCHMGNKHGHHPGHGFEPATKDTVLALAAETMLAPGRNVRHNAICDGCDKKIYGVRHKCLSCPDWDYCNDCAANAHIAHPRHRFAIIYQPIADQHPSHIRHFGIYCDGPLCKNVTNPSYITGVRYKCAVCNDTDFCASCEAVPTNSHNRTHPLIKFKTPVRNCSITTANEDVSGQVRIMGDHKATPSPPTSPPTINKASEVQTMAEIKPSEVKDTALPIPVITPQQKAATGTAERQPLSVDPTDLNARFVQDAIPDGQIFAPGTRFTQIWTMCNPGPHAWPAGCSVRFVGGDNMLNVDNGHPAAVSDISEASESNVIGREVGVNEEVAFKVTLKAPSRLGKAISYWRIKASDGTPFGHRLWCDIQVKRSDMFDPAQLAAGLKQGSVSQQQQFLARMQAHQTATQIQAHQAQLQAQMQAQLQQQRLQTERKRMEEIILRSQAQQQREQQIELMRETVHCFAGANPMPAPTEEDTARKEAAKLRVEHIKAKILKARDQRAQALEARVAAAKAKHEKSMLEAAKQEPKEETMMHGSAMVFPKLDKESPASSTYQSATSSSGKGKAAYVENENGDVERSATPTAALVLTPMSEPSVTSQTEDGYDTLADDIEVWSSGGMDSDDDDGFLTDEEYDILDASDHETVHSP